MWIGILVLITFSLCTIACLVLSIRGAMQGKWHVFGALLLPAFGIGGTIVMLVAKPISLELFGDPNLEDVPESAERLTGDALMQVHDDTVRFGLAYDDETGTFNWYDEVYSPDGGYKGRNDAGVTWGGGWDLVEARSCRSIGQDETCYDNYRDGEYYYDVNHRNEIVNRYLMMPGVTGPSGDTMALTEGALAALVPGRTLAGELQLHFGAPFYSAEFAGGSDVVTVRRGSDAGNLADEENGTYSIGEDGSLCLAGILHIVEECLTLVPRPGGLDLVRDGNRIVATVAAIN